MAQVLGSWLLQERRIESWAPSFCLTHLVLNVSGGENYAREDFLTFPLFFSPPLSFLLSAKREAKKIHATHFQLEPRGEFLTWGITTGRAHVSTLPYGLNAHMSDQSSLPLGHSFYLPSSYLPSFPVVLSLHLFHFFVISSFYFGTGS